jgi:hypothetical protein
VEMNKGAYFAIVSWGIMRQRWLRGKEDGSRTRDWQVCHCSYS